MLFVARRRLADGRYRAKGAHQRVRLGGCGREDGMPAGSTRNAKVFGQVSDLQTVRIQDNIGMVDGKAAAWKTQMLGTTPNNTDFTKINGIKIMDQEGKPKQ